MKKKSPTEPPDEGAFTVAFIDKALEVARKSLKDKPLRLIPWDRWLSDREEEE